MKKIGLFSVNRRVLIATVKLVTSSFGIIVLAMLLVITILVRFGRQYCMILESRRLNIQWRSLLVRICGGIGWELKMVIDSRVVLDSLVLSSLLRVE